MDKPRKQLPEYEMHHVNHFEWKSLSIQSVWNKLAEDEDFEFTEWTEETIGYEMVINFGTDIGEKLKTIDPNKKERIFLYLIVYLCGSVCFASGADTCRIDDAKKFYSSFGDGEFVTVVDKNNPNKVLMVTGNERDRKIKESIEELINGKMTSHYENIMTTDAVKYSWLEYADISKYYMN